MGMLFIIIVLTVYMLMLLNVTIGLFFCGNDRINKILEISYCILLGCLFIICTIALILAIT